MQVFFSLHLYSSKQGTFSKEVCFLSHPVLSFQNYWFQTSIWVCLVGVVYIYTPYLKNQNEINKMRDCHITFH